jgi:hypothetical protein
MEETQVNKEIVLKDMEDMLDLLININDNLKKVYVRMKNVYKEMVEND